MSEQETYDLAIIGAGPGGYVAALRAAQLGLKTVCIEKEAALGGTCLRVGCVPSKALLESSEHYEHARQHLKEHGVLVDEVGLDLSRLLKRKERVVRTLTGGIAFLFKKNGVTRLRGLGTLLGRRQDGAFRLGITGADQGELTARRVILATGSEISLLPGVELDGDRIGGSTEALSWNEVPRELIVIGAGVIGLELSSVWRRLGAKVTVLEFADGCLPGMDEEVRTLAGKLFKRQGLKLNYGVRVTGVERRGDRVVVSAAEGGPWEADRVLVAVGRRPHTTGLGLESVGLKTDRRGQLWVDPHLQTEVEGIYAIGDLIRGPMLAHKAEEEGVAAVEYMQTGHGHVDYGAIPAVVYTDPEIASVGRTEAACIEEGLPIRTGQFPFIANSRARALGSTDGFVKIIAHAETDRVLGVHMIGPRVSELIVEATSALSFGASSEDLARMCHAHPTLHEVVKEAAMAVDGRAIHI